MITLQRLRISEPFDAELVKSKDFLTSERQNHAAIKQQVKYVRMSDYDGTSVN